MPRMKLAKRAVDAFSCPAGTSRATLFDTELVGFHVEALRSGRKIYRLKWKKNGKQGRETLGEHGVITVEQARARAVSLRGRLFDGENPSESRAAEAAARQRAINLADLIESWLKDGRGAAPSKRESSWSTDARKLRGHIVPLLGKKLAGEITKADIENAQRRIAEGGTARDMKTRAHGRSIAKGGPGAARSAVMSLSSCYSWAKGQGIVDDNPCLHVKKSKPRKMERFLSQGEAVHLLKVVGAMESAHELDGGFADMLRLLLLTGARKSEIQDLRWREIDTQRRLIRLPRERSKTGEKNIPLNDEALRILHARRPLELHGNGKQSRPVMIYVFPSRRGEGPAQGLQKAWERVRQRASLADVRLHDLRHSFASFAAANGASLFLIGKALGHSQSQTTERYAHLRDDPLHAIAAIVQKSIFPKQRSQQRRQNRDA